MHPQYKLYRSPDGFGNINYSNPAGAQPPFINIAGARNGTSIDASSFVVLGQAIGAPGSPADLMNNREINMRTFYFNLFGGQSIFSDVANAGDGITPLQIYQTLNGTAGGPAASVNATWNTTGLIVSALQVNVTDPTPGINRMLIWAKETATQAGLQLSTDGNSLYTGTAGTFYASITGHTTTTGTIPGNAATFEAFDLIQPSTGNGRYRGFADFGSFTPSGGATQYIAFDTEAVMDATLGTGDVHGLFVNWAIVSAPTLPGKLVAIENVSGDVYLNSKPGAFIGRTGIHNMRSPTAWVHIGAGAAAPSSAPLKFTGGTLMLTPEAGAMEYNGNDLFFTSASAVRLNILRGNGGAAAPALTPTPVFTSFYGNNTNALGDPNAWATLVIAGTTFKIPLYT